MGDHNVLDRQFRVNAGGVDGFEEPGMPLGPRDAPREPSTLCRRGVYWSVVPGANDGHTVVPVLALVHLQHDPLVRQLS